MSNLTRLETRRLDKLHPKLQSILATNTSGKENVRVFVMEPVCQVFL